MSWLRPHLGQLARRRTPPSPLQRLLWELDASGMHGQAQADLIRQHGQPAIESLAGEVLANVLNAKIWLTLDPVCAAWGRYAKCAGLGDWATIPAEQTRTSNRRTESQILADAMKHQDERVARAHAQAKRRQLAQVSQLTGGSYHAG